MGYETVDPGTLQALLGSPPVATSGGDPVATQGGSTEAQEARVHYSPARPPGYEPYVPPQAPVDTSIDPFHQLIASLGNNLYHMDFNAALNDINNLDRHLSMGLDHWQRFIAGEVG
jgi:hypothetical protein